MPGSPVPAGPVSGGPISGGPVPGGPMSGGSHQPRSKEVNKELPSEDRISALSLHSITVNIRKLKLVWSS